MTAWNISIDVSEINGIITDEELLHYVEDVIEEVAVDLLVELQSPPPQGTPVDTGEARNAWQIDMSNRLSPEVYNTADHLPALNDGSSTQSPTGFVEIAADKVTRD